MAHFVPVRAVRAARPGRPDGSSARGVYIVRWMDEDMGQRQAEVVAASAEDAEAEISGLVGNNTVQVHGPVRIIA